VRSLIQRGAQMRWYLAGAHGAWVSQLTHVRNHCTILRNMRIVISESLVWHSIKKRLGRRAISQSDRVICGFDMPIGLALTQLPPEALAQS